MCARQVSVRIDSLGLESRRMGALPLINHFIARLGLERQLERFVPTADQRTRIPHAQALGVLLRSILVERVALYRQEEQVSLYDAGLFGLGDSAAPTLSDDRVGRGLDRLFDADRQALLTEVTLALGRRFDVSFERFHNDSTTVRFCGQYAGPAHRSIRGRKPAYITHGFSKDHRPDLKQLLFVLTTSDDGHVPVGFRVLDGNVNDTRTHVETWDELRRITGKADFLYVADSKLCALEPLDHIDRKGGHLITVLPRSRGEDRDFRRWIQDHEPDWETVIDQENPRGQDKPRDVWRAWRSKLPSREGWPIIWVFSSVLALHQAERRRGRIQRAEQQLEVLSQQLANARTRLRKRSKLHARLKEILVDLNVTRYLHVDVHTDELHEHRQVKRGRPGPNTTYRRIVKKRYRIEWHVREDVIEQERKHDGMYPLLTNDRSLTPAEVLHHHKRQPCLEKRFTQLKDVWEIAPVFLKNTGRVEALFFVYALAMIVQALIERELRQAMAREEIESLPLYPEERPSKQPTAMLVMRLFAPLERHVILADGVPVKTVPPKLSPLQKQVLKLLGVPGSAYHRA
jgi:transposase